MTAASLVRARAVKEEMGSGGRAEDLQRERPGIVTDVAVLVPDGDRRAGPGERHLVDVRGAEDAPVELRAIHPDAEVDAVAGAPGEQRRGRIAEVGELGVGEAVP